MSNCLSTLGMANNPRQQEKAEEKQSARESCFVIMPFGGNFDVYYEKVYVPAIEDAGLEAKRADDLYRPSAIIHDIWNYTKQAKLVLADLSGKNPNVFYELGLAHVLTKPAIMVTESLADVPFDLRSLRVIEYDKQKPDWGETLRNKITASISEVLASPQKAVLPTFLQVSDTEKAPPVTSIEKALLEMNARLESLERTQITHSAIWDESMNKATYWDGTPAASKRATRQLEEYMQSLDSRELQRLAEMVQSLLPDRARNKGPNLDLLRRASASGGPGEGGRA